MQASLAEIRIAYAATFNQRLPGDKTFVSAGQEVFNKLGSAACKQRILHIRLILSEQPGLKFEEVVALVKGWEVRHSFDAYMIITGTGAVISHDETLKGALDDALEQARERAAKEAN